MQRDKQRNRERCSIYGFILQMPATASAGPGKADQTQEPGTPTGSRNPSHHLLLPRVGISRKLEMEPELGLECRHLAMGNRHRSHGLHAHPRKAVCFDQPSQSSYIQVPLDLCMDSFLVG